MNAPVMALAEPLICRFEGFRPGPYLCPAGVPTIGYGSTSYPDGRRVSLEDRTCTEAEARVYLEFDMKRVLAALQGSGAITRDPCVHQAAALLCLAYNIGATALACSTLVSRFNAGDLAGAADQFLVWDKAHVGKTIVALAGLSDRRHAERSLFLTPDTPPPG